MVVPGHKRALVDENIAGLVETIHEFSNKRLMKNKKGTLVECKSGKGVVYHGEKPIGDKIPVYLVDERFCPLIERGQQKKVMSTISKLRIIGYVD